MNSNSKSNSNLNPAWIPNQMIQQVIGPAIFDQKHQTFNEHSCGYWRGNDSVF